MPLQYAEYAAKYTTEGNFESLRGVSAKYLAHVTGTKAVLEVSAGDGTRIAHLATSLPTLISWHPTEYDEQVLCC